ncbi:MAG: LytTR family DNA-binding domain-containing protein [Ruminiclostridium sp.]|nr:LytTR family DNA-binding domain-containing protein [Ruminiclostridium sp.]
MITIALCDNDISYLKTLYKSIKTAAYKAKIQADIHIFSNGMKLLKEYENGKRFDIVILDIDMPLINGKELAARLRRIDFSFFLVFVTAFENEMEKAIRYRINAFILKSSDSTKMNSEFKRVFSEYLLVSPQYEVFDILKDGILSTCKVELSNILGFYLSEKIIYLKTDDNDYILKERRFNEILERFLGKNFFECHRNYIVNLNRISEITDSAVILENGDKFPLSKRNHSRLVKEFASCVTEKIDS